MQKEACVLRMGFQPLQLNSDVCHAEIGVCAKGGLCDWTLMFVMQKEVCMLMVGFATELWRLWGRKRHAKGGLLQLNFGICDVERGAHAKGGLCDWTLTFVRQKEVC